MPQKDRDASAKIWFRAGKKCALYDAFTELTCYMEASKRARVIFDGLSDACHSRGLYGEDLDKEIQHTCSEAVGLMVNAEEGLFIAREITAKMLADLAIEVAEELHAEGQDLDSDAAPGESSEEPTH